MRTLQVLILTYFLILSQFSIHLAECKKKRCKSAGQNPEQCAKAIKKKALERAKFEEWEKWGQQFPMCDETKNPNLGPVNIVTKNAIQVKDELPLIIYSGPPQAAMYFYSTEFVYEGVLIQAGVHRLRMEVSQLNVHSRKENFRDITYIAGVGNTDYRYFQSAMFLFTVNPVESERSLHQINGKNFMLEIVLTFAEIARSGERPSDITQIHVMVEKSATIHPGWKFLEEGILGVTSLSDIPIDSNDQVQNAQSDFKHATKLVHRLRTAEKTELETDTYLDLAQDLEIMYKSVAGAERIDELQEKVNKLKDSAKKITDEIEAAQKSKAEVQKSMDSIKEEITREIASGIMMATDKNEKTDKIDNLHRDLLIHEKKIGELETKLNKLQTKIWEVSSDLDKKTELVRRSNIGNSEGSKFKSVKELKKKLDEMKTKADEISAAEDDLVLKKDALETLQSQSARDVLIASTPFQISWLLPPIGGYYRYNGSSLVPPCTPRTRVIVMEKSIPMSQEQFTAISNYTIRGRFQTEFDAEVPPQGMDDAIPVFQELGDRQIFYNHKNLEFKMDDALHMQSKLRRQIKDSMRISGAYQLKIWNKTTLFSVFIILSIFLH